MQGFTTSKAWKRPAHRYRNYTGREALRFQSPEVRQAPQAVARRVNAIRNGGKILLDLRIGCRHRRTSFPVSPATKPGAPPGQMYVVCLDCGKHFEYDWEHMRVGALIEDEVTHTPDSKPAVHKRSMLRYYLAAMTLPVVWLIGKAALGPKRSKPEKEQKPET